MISLATKLLTHYQKRLKLQDWAIICQYVKAEDLPKNTNAVVTFHLETRTAKINIKRMTYKKMEWWIIHELLHIHFAFAGKRPDGYELNEEQAINAITGALIGE